MVEKNLEKSISRASRERRNGAKSREKSWKFRDFNPEITTLCTEVSTNARIKNGHLWVDS